MARAGTTVVIATHERDLARLIDRTVELADGVVVSTTAAAEAAQAAQGREMPG